MYPKALYYKAMYPKDLYPTDKFPVHSQLNIECNIDLRRNSLNLNLHITLFTSSPYINCPDDTVDEALYYPIYKP